MSDADKQTSLSDKDVDNDSASGPDSGLGRIKRRIPRAGTSLVRVACFSYLAILGTLVLMETRMVYPGVYMDEREEVTPHPDAPKIVEVEYESHDGVRLRGRLLERPGNTRTVLFFHGNGTRACWLDPWNRRLSDAFDATVLVAEYRGFDGSGPTPNEEGVIADSLAAQEYLCEREGIEPTDLILFGNSLGGGCAVAVAARSGCKMLLLDRTFDAAVNVAADRFPFVPVKLLMRNQYDSLDRIGEYHGPLIQLHGTTDKVIPIHHGRRLFEAANEPKRWVEVPGLGHNERLPDEGLAKMVLFVEDFTADPRP